MPKSKAASGSAAYANDGMTTSSPRSKPKAIIAMVNASVPDPQDIA